MLYRDTFTMYHGRPIPIPNVSVLMPVHNGVRFLERAVTSLLVQTFSDWELLAVDNGSTDESTARLYAFAATEPRLRVFRHVVSRGQAAARKMALAAAQGEWVACLDQGVEFDFNHQVWAWTGGLIRETVADAINDLSSIRNCRRPGCGGGRPRIATIGREPHLLFCS